MKIKEKLYYLDKLFLEKKLLNDIIKSTNENYKINDLVTLGYISVIKKGEIYYNNTIKSVKNPYIIGGAYMNFENYMFGGLDRYNKEGFTTQISNIFTIYNTKFSKEIEILGIKYKFKKIKEQFLYGKKSINIDGYKIFYMNKERLFLEFVRDYIDYKNDFFIEIYQTLDENRISKIMGKYPLKQIILKIQEIQKCI